MERPSPRARGETRRVNALVASVLAATLVACTGVAPPSSSAPGSAEVATRATPTQSPAASTSSSAPVPSAPDAFVFPGRASRVVVPAMGIDLPVVSSDVAPPPGNFPLCDVAQYLTTYRQPGEPGTTYLYAHARVGMFLPLLQASLRADGAEMIGAEVLVYASDARLYRYRVFEVQRHVTDYALANGTPPGERRLILQTSEGPRGTEGKLVLAAELVDEVMASPAEANPPASPVVCE